MSDGERIVVEFRERADSAAVVVAGYEFDPGEAVVSCYVCGSWGIVDGDPKVVNADHPDTDDQLVCETCDERGAD